MLVFIDLFRYFFIPFFLSLFRSLCISFFHVCMYLFRYFFLQ